MVTDSNVTEFRPVIQHHLRTAADLAKATGEDLGQPIWSELHGHEAPEPEWESEKLARARNQIIVANRPDAGFRYGCYLIWWSFWLFYACKRSEK